MTALLFALVLSQAAAVPMARDSRIAVYVTAPARDGFVDTTHGIRDSIQDIKKRLQRKSRLFVLTEHQDQADIVVRVLGRGRDSEQSGALYLPTGSGGLIEAPRYVAWKIVRAQLEVGTFVKDVSAFDSNLEEWGDVAAKIAKHVQAWAEANGDTLRQRRLK